MVQPLLELLRRYTGYYITLIAGVPLTEGEKEFELKSYVTHPQQRSLSSLILWRSLNAGKASGNRTWHGVEGTHFQNEVMPSFTRFLLETPGALHYASSRCSLLTCVQNIKIVSRT